MFNGTFTIQNKTTGEHRTFRIKTQKDDARFAPSKRIVSLLTGPDNTSDYKGFGFVDDNGIYVWTKNKGVNEKSKYEWYAIMLWQLANNPESRWHEKYSISIEKRCLRCNRVLTHPESLLIGIGPECASKL